MHTLKSHLAAISTDLGHGNPNAGQAGPVLCDLQSLAGGC